MTVSEKTPHDYWRGGAGDWNAFARAANAHLDGRGVTPPPVPRIRGASIIRVENTTGSDVARFGILGVNGITISPTDNADQFKSVPCVEGYTPATGTHEGKFVITLEPIAAGAIGKAVVSGLAVCELLVLDEDHRFATIINSGTGGLVSAAVGSAQILYVESGTGTKWALVRLGNAFTGGRWAKASADWVHAAGNASYVMAQLCDDKDGTGAAGTAVKVWLTCPESMDPNVYSGQTILIRPDPGDVGNYVVVSDVNDAKIGTVQMRTGGSAPQGWREMTATGGATFNISGRVPVGTTDAKVPGDVVGDEDHTHIPHTVTQTDASEQYGGTITVIDETDHDTVSNWQPSMYLMFIERVGP